ncbi:hypothetical protein [Bacillus thuringiensis]|uniref:hypothetical protein n=1 Tax=Bacillus thuringiensis TaxID=1428 RepID=UPI0015CF2209|nr:hypothetical protein [Bacillus thuringiensis]
MEKFPFIGCAMVLIIFIAVFSLGYFVAKVGFIAFVVFLAILGVLFVLKAL